MQEINFRLHSYESIFSDFDSRGYLDRSLSIDFIDELKRASKDKEKGKHITIRLSLKKEKRNSLIESEINQRLIAHFEKHKTRLSDEKKKIIKSGAIFAISGITVMIIATTIYLKWKDGNFLREFLILLSEPAGWFLFWEGLNQIVFETKKEKHNLDFYEKMQHAKIKFVNEHKSSKLY